MERRWWRRSAVTWRASIGAATLAAALASAAAGAQSDSTPPNGATTRPARQSLGDAWWTGPMLAASGGTLPHGHFLFEPYFYDVTAPRTNGLGSLSYIIYGLIDRLSVGMIPAFGFNAMRGAPSSSGIGV